LYGHPLLLILDLKLTTQTIQLTRDNHTDIQTQLGQPGSFLSIVQIILQQGSVILNFSTTTTGCGHDRLHSTTINKRPPGINQLPGILPGALQISIMMAHCATTPPLLNTSQLDTKTIQYPGRGGIDLRCQRRLHTTLENQHLTLV